MLDNFLTFCTLFGKDTQIFLDGDGKEYYRHEGFFPEEDLIKVLEEKGVK